MRSFLLHLIPPAIALFVLLSFWNKNQNANTHLEELRGRADRLEQTLAQFKPPQIASAAVVAPVENLAAEEPEQEDEEPEELPPLVVPGTVEELATTAAGMITKMLEVQAAFGDEEPARNWRRPPPE